MDTTQEIFRLNEEMSHVVVRYLQIRGWEAKIVMREGLEGMDDWEQLQAVKDGVHFHMDTAFFKPVRGRRGVYMMLKHHFAKVRK